MAQLERGTHLTREGAIAILTMSNPGKRNAFSVEMREDLTRHLEDLQRDSSCRAIVLQGADGCFSAGGDVSGFGTKTVIDYRAGLIASHRFVRLLITGEKPVVAAVEGYAYGAGLGLALCCDQVVAARDAKLCASFAKIGLMPDMGLLWTLPQRVGVGRAKEMIMLATVVGAEEGLGIGLVDEVADSGGALAAAMALAERFAATAPSATGLTKAMLARHPLGLEDQLEWEAQGQGLLFTTADVAEGVAAFRAKRPATFKGE